jgi:barstar (barnase inhibitor)
LRERGYQVVSLDASGWMQDADLHRDIADALDFPDYYGHNLDALNDCLRDVVTYDYGTSRDVTGLVLTFTGYDAFADRCPRTAQVVLDILADQARSAALIGHRICCLIQSNNPNIRFDPVGAMPVLWNDAEWLDSSRRQDPS